MHCVAWVKQVPHVGTYKTLRQKATATAMRAWAIPPHMYLVVIVKVALKQSETC